MCSKDNEWLWRQQLIKEAKMDMFGIHASCYVLVSTLFSVSLIHRETGLPWTTFICLVPLLIAAHCLAVVLVTVGRFNSGGVGIRLGGYGDREAHVKLAGLWVLTFVTLMASVQ
jgi:hypothetical protein